MFNQKQLIISIGTILLALIVFIIPMETTQFAYGYYKTNTHLGVKIAIVIAITLIGTILTFYFKDKK